MLRKKKIAAFLSAGLLLPAFTACIEILGESHYSSPVAHITENITWTSGSVIDITQYTIVDEGVTLTVEPGVTIRLYEENTVTLFDMFEYTGIEVQGTIIAAGTAMQPVSFVSSTAAGNSGQLLGLVFDQRADDKASRVEYCVFRSLHQAIVCYQSSPGINNCAFDNNEYGIMLTGSQAQIHNCSFTCMVDAIRVTGSSPVIDDNEFNMMTYPMEWTGAVTLYGHSAGVTFNDTVTVPSEFVRNNFFIDFPQSVTTHPDSLPYEVAVRMLFGAENIDASGNYWGIKPWQMDYALSPDDIIWDGNDDPWLDNDQTRHRGLVLHDGGATVPF